MKPSTAVIILNWNGEKLLKRFLPAVIANTPAELADIIVADNGSTDGSLKLLADEFPMVRTIRFTENHGFARGYNLAIEEADYRYTLLLNSDAEPTAGWLEPLIAAMEADPKLGACQPKIRSVREPEMFEYAGAAGGFLDRHGFPYCRGRIFDSIEKDCGQYDSDTPLATFWASGAALMVRTDLYLQLGGLDPTFFAHMEEIDLCWRMQLSGYSVATVTQSVLRHLGGASLDASNPKKTYLNFRNNLLMMHKNLPPRVRQRRLFVRRSLDTIAFMRFIATGRWHHAAAVFRAHCDYRKLSQSLPTAPDNAPDLLKSAPNHPVSILIAYYLKRRRQYSAL